MFEVAEVRFETLGVSRCWEAEFPGIIFKHWFPARTRSNIYVDVAISGWISFGYEVAKAKIWFFVVAVLQR